MAETDKNEQNSVQESTIVDVKVTSNDSENKKILVKERYEIHFDKPISWLNMNGAQAYSVTDRIDSRRELFALICSRETCPRNSYLPYFKSIEHANLLNLVEFGTIYDSSQNQNTVALIYAIPQGGRVLDNMDKLNIRNNPQKLKSIILSLISVVETLKGYGLTHRAIRPDNLFFKNKEYDEIVLGDCLASFPAFYQPAAYETIESLMAYPFARGNGTEKNDLYAIGATAIGLLLENEPFKDMSVPEIIRLKMKKGSFMALTLDEKLPSSFLNFNNMFKGILDDHSNYRWTFIQVYNFLEGKNQYLNNNNQQEKIKRSLTINGEKCYSAREVAYNLYMNPTEAWELIKSNKLLEWIKNGLENEDIYNEAEKICSQINESSSHGLIIAQMCLMLDSDAPIHLRDLSVFPDGAGKAVYYCIKHNINYDNFRDLFASDLIRNWYIKQENLRAPSNISEIKININRNDIGYGLDRIIYDIDDDLPCLSPLIGKEYVTSAARVLKALDKNYPNIKGEVLPYDKNIVAFLRSKLGKKIDGILLDLNSQKEGMQISAIIRLYADMQKNYGPIQVVNLGQWLSSVSKPIIESYHNLKVQKKIEKNLVKVSKSGKLIEIYQALEDQETKEKDIDMYKKTKKEILSLIYEKNKILTQSNKIIEEAKSNALKFTSILAVMTMVASFTFNLIEWITK